MENSKYYLFYRINNGDWKSVYYRSFLITTSIDKIYGQFISSNWFNLNLDGVSDIDLAVVRLNDQISSFAHDCICEQLLNAPETLPECVVAYQGQFNTDEFKNTSTKKIVDSCSSVKKYIGEKKGSTMNVALHAHFDPSISTQVRHSLCFPEFVISKC